MIDPIAEDPDNLVLPLVKKVAEMNSLEDARLVSFIGSVENSNLSGLSEGI